VVNIINQSGETQLRSTQIYLYPCWMSIDMIHQLNAIFIKSRWNSVI